jgi:hypothetical protein
MDVMASSSSFSNDGRMGKKKKKKKNHIHTHTATKFLAMRIV